MNRMLVTLASVALLGGMGLSTASPATATAKYKACVKKSTGEMRMTGKKCKKGWKKVTWTKSGPTGEKGPTGDAGQANSMGTVLDGSGANVGRLLSLVGAGASMLVVEIDGGRYLYYGNGLLLPNYSPHYTNSTCTGSAYAFADTLEDRDVFLKTSSLRMVYRATAGSSFGTPESYKANGRYESAFNQPTWSRDSAGTCSADFGGFTGYLVVLDRVANGPTDRPGPLTVR